MLFDKAVNPVVIFARDLIRFDFLPARRHFVKHGDVKVAVDYKRKSSRYRSSRHNENVRVFALFAKQGSLINAEAVLLVRNRKTEIIKLDILLNNSVRADNKVGFAVLDSLFYFTLFLCFERTCQQLTANSRVFEHLFK